ncbi:MAG TPA: alpha/beta hydrolase [Polyangiaceae bacterium]|jgi:pimeloyl-ACP methyl ester carboxylesterase
MQAIEEWRRRGRTVDTPDGRVWAVEVGQEKGGDAPVLVLHGFPTSSWDFGPAIERVSQTRRVVAFDFLGYGLSDKPREFAASLFEQADVAELVARAFGITRAHVWAHDMGTSVATELCARRERGLLSFAMESLVLMNGSVHIELAHLTLGQQVLKSRLGPIFARLNTKLSFKAQMRRVFARPPSEAELDAMWALVAREDGTALMPALIRYTEERARFRRRWIGALERLDLPAFVAWGARDPVAVLPIADALAREIPGCERVTWEDLGHYPQVEDPERVARALIGFWDRLASARGAHAPFA